MKKECRIWNMECRMSRIRRFLCAVILFVSLFNISPAARAQENIQFFGSEPLASEQDKGRNLLECLKGWRQFLSAFIGSEGFVDYWRDIFVLSFKWPMYFSDINNVEMQLNRSRYAVMAAFMRCDMNRLKPVTQAYYKLEAELYFLRHFVDVSGGVLNFQTKSRGNRNDFRDAMLEYFKLRKKGDEDKALFTGYFDEFEGKYADRAEQYSGYGDDPIYSDISSKFDDLIKTFEDFGSEAAELGGDIAEATVEGFEAAVQAGKTGLSAIAHPINALGNLAKEVNSRFQACPATGHPDECKTIDELAKIGLQKGIEGAKKFGQLSLTLVGGIVATPIGIGKVSVEKIIDLVSGSGVKVTPDEVQRIVDDLGESSQMFSEKGDMLARYELLYGQVAGDGVIELTNRMDVLLNILGDKESLPRLKKVAQCAKTVRNRACNGIF